MEQLWLDSQVVTLPTMPLRWPHPLNFRYHWWLWRHLKIYPKQAEFKKGVLLFKNLSPAKFLLLSLKFSFALSVRCWHRAGMWKAGVVQCLCIRQRSLNQVFLEPSCLWAVQAHLWSPLLVLELQCLVTFPHCVDPVQFTWTQFSSWFSVHVQEELCATFSHLLCSWPSQASLCSQVTLIRDDTLSLGCLCLGEKSLWIHWWKNWWDEWWEKNFFSKPS